MWRVIAIVIGVAGCNQVLGIEQTQLPDAPKPIGCSGELFMNPIAVPGFDGGDSEYDASPRKDGLEIWFVKHVTADSEYRIHRATRSSTLEAFTTIEQNRFAPGIRTSDPALTDDGLRLVYLANGNQQAFEVTRPSWGEELGAPVPLAGLGEISGIAGLDISFDGLTLYFSTVSGELWAATRPALDRAFDDRRMLFTGAIYPSISPDELELFYNSPADAPTSSRLLRRVRESPTAPFDPQEQLILDHGVDPEVSPDASTLIYAANGGFMMMQRTCPES
jgi:hypothetical protein